VRSHASALAASAAAIEGTARAAGDDAADEWAAGGDRRALPSPEPALWVVGQDEWR
jgi:hypothetical protein